MSRSAKMAAAVLAAGCAHRPQLVPPSVVVPAPRAGCGDVLAVRVAGRPALDGRGCVAADGTMPLGPLGAVPAEGLGLDAIRIAVAEVAGVPADAVSVELAEPHATAVYLRLDGRLTVLPHLHGETVAGLLARAGRTAVGPVVVRRPDFAGPPRTFAVPLLDAVAVEPGDVVTAR